MSRLSSAVAKPLSMKTEQVGKAVEICCIVVFTAQFD